MSRSYVPKVLREQIAAEARHRCGYCLTSTSIMGTPMEIDHIIPASLGGPTVKENLWLACSMCNDHKGNRIAASDPHTGEIVRIFDPRPRSGRSISPGARRETRSSARHPPAERRSLRSD